MIYFKIYFTLIIIIFIIGVSSWLLMNSDNKRSDLWFRISQISWITLLVMVVIGSLTTIWYLPS